MSSCAVSAETVRNISQVRKVRLEDACRVGFDAASSGIQTSIGVHVYEPSLMLECCSRFHKILRARFSKVTVSQLGRQLTERQLDYKLNSSFRFTNVRHVKSTLSQLMDE